MAGGFQFELVSPEKLIISTEASQVVVPGEEGDFAFLASHAPLMSNLRAGLVALTSTESSDEQMFFIKGGLAEGGAHGLTILAEFGQDVKSMDKTQIDDALKEANKQLEDADTDAETKQAQDMIAILQGLH